MDRVIFLPLSIDCKHLSIFHVSKPSIFLLPHPRSRKAGAVETEKIVGKREEEVTPLASCTDVPGLYIPWS